MPAPACRSPLLKASFTCAALSCRISLLSNRRTNKAVTTVKHIRPATGWQALNLRELWQYRDLLTFLTLRSIQTRYKQTILGFAWALIRPVAAMVVFTVIFGRIAQIPSDGIPYPIFSYTALLPWSLFTTALGGAANSLVSNSRFINKIYFPRLVIPIAAIFAALVDFLLSFIVMIALMVYYQVTPTVNLVWLPFFTIFAMLTALAFGLLFSALNVRFRDVSYAQSYIVQFWLYLTPVVYPSTLVPDSWRVIYDLNPMTHVVNGYRWGLIGADTPPNFMTAVSFGLVLLLLLLGMFYFKRTESSFADLI